MEELKRGEERPVWVKAKWVSDWDGDPRTYGVDKIILISPDGEHLWDWLIFAEDVAHVPRDSG